MRWLRSLFLCLCLLAVSPPGRSSAAFQGPPTIAAASDLQFALEAIAQAFTAETGERVTLVFGSSGNLARQAMNGAPFELFLSADEAFVNLLADAGDARDRGMLYAIGRIVLFAPRGSPLVVDEQMNGLRALIERGTAGFALQSPIRNMHPMDAPPRRRYAREACGTGFSRRSCLAKTSPRPRSLRQPVAPPAESSPTRSCSRPR